jgi:hypothetical protein
VPGPPAPPPGSLRWSIEGILGFTRWRIGWWLLTHTEVTPTLVQLRALHAALLTPANDLFSDGLPNETTAGVSRLVAYGLGSEIEDSSFYLAHGNRGAAAPPAACPVVAWTVTARGKGREGRTYLPGVAFFDVQFQRELTPGAHSAIQSALVQFRTTVEAIVADGFGPLQFGVLHRRSGGEWLALSSLQPVNDVILRTSLGTQTRRQHSHTSI